LTRFFAPAPTASLVFLRVVFGLLIAISASGLLLSGWVGEQARSASEAFKWLGLAWVPLPGAPWLQILCATAAIAALGVALGLFYRPCAVALALLLAWALAADQALYSNTLYLIALVAFWLCFAPVDRRFSRDALRHPALGPSWPLYMLRFQTAVVYLYAGVAKLDRDWLAGRPLEVWLEPHRADPILGALLRPEWSPPAFAWAGLLFDLLLVPALLWRRTRLLAFLAAVLFHAFNAIWLKVFPLPILSVALTLLFFAPDWPQRLLGRKKQESAQAAAVGSAASPPRWLLACLCLYAAVQLVAPLRHHLYRGDVDWNEWGHEFSWRLRARAKTVRTSVRIVEPAAGMETGATLEGLSPLQRRFVERHPDGLGQFCRRLGRRLRESGRDIEVRARVLVELNGRRARDLVDRSVDLSRTPRTLATPAWVLPGPE